jgi:S-formylglutathione hydrolase FrmB
MKGILSLCFLLCAFTFAHADPISSPPPDADSSAPPTTLVSPEGCAIEKFSVYSPSMGREIKAVVVLPPEYNNFPDKSYPILYTFHGTSAPYDTFAKMAPLRQALKDKPMIVTCFDADSDATYIDSPCRLPTGRNPKDTTPVKYLFTTFFLKEFIPAIDKSYRVNPTQRMLTGFSMGGFGAFHYMLAAPGNFVAVSSMSGFFKSLVTLNTADQDWFKPLLGSYTENQKRFAALDLYTQIKKQHATGIKFPPIYLTCGTEDHFLPDNQAMHAFLQQQGIPCEYHESPGDQNLAFWESNIGAIIDFHWRALQKK